MDLVNRINEEELELSKKKAHLLMESWDSMKKSKKNSGSYAEKNSSISEGNSTETPFHTMSREELVGFIFDGEMDTEKLLDNYSNEELVEIAIEKSKKQKDEMAMAEKESYKKGLVDLGIYESIQTLLNCSLKDHPSFSIVINKYRSLIESKGISESYIVYDFLKDISNFNWDNTVKTEVTKIEESVRSNESRIAVEKTIGAVRNDPSWKFYSDATKIMTEWVKNGELSEKMLAKNLSRWSFNQHVNGLVNKLNEMESIKNKSLNVPSKQGESYVEKVFSPVEMFEGNTTFYLSGKYYTANESGISTNNSPTDEFKNVVESFNNQFLKVGDDGAIFYIGKTKIAIVMEDENKNVYLDGKNIQFSDISGLAKLVESRFSGGLNQANPRIVKDIITIYENLENIVEIDFAKSIRSRIYEDLSVNLLKWNDKIYVNKVNPSMRENSIYESTGRKAVRFVKELLNYDISEGLTEYLEGEDRVRSIMINDRSRVLENIQAIESEIKKIETEIASNRDLSESKEIMVAKSALEKEIEILKEKWNLINTELQKIDSIDFDSIGDLFEDAKFSIGDVVKVKESGDTGKIISIDGTTGVYTVLHDSGKTGSYRTDEIVDLEEALKQAATDNQESSSDDSAITSDEESAEDKE